MAALDLAQRSTLYGVRVTVKLPRTLVNQLLAQAQQCPAEEVCGLVAARDGQPVSVYPVANRYHDPRRFAMDEAEQVSAFRHMREAGETLFAIYHSHPHAAAVPSELDLRHSAYPQALYLIISLNTQGVLELRGFSLQQMEAVEVPLQMV